MIPDPHHRMGHVRFVGAPPGVVWDELHGLTMSMLPLSLTLEAVRLLPARLAGRKHRPLAGRSFFDVTPIPVLFWTEPGWIKVAMAFRLEPTSRGTVLSTETRVLATDPATQRAFARYWYVIRPCSGAIRREVLRTVAHRAEAAAAMG